MSFNATAIALVFWGTTQSKPRSCGSSNNSRSMQERIRPTSSYSSVPPKMGHSQITQSTIGDLRTKWPPTCTRDHDHNRSMFRRANDGPRLIVVQQAMRDNMSHFIREGHMPSKRKLPPTSHDRRARRLQNTLQNQTRSQTDMSVRTLKSAST